MDPETFTLRKNFLEEFYKDRTKFNYFDLSIAQDDEVFLTDTQQIIFKTEVIFLKGDFNINTKEVFKLIKPLIYYLYSITSKKNFVRENLFLLVESIMIKYGFLVGNADNKVNIDININLGDMEQGDIEEGNSFLEYYDEKKN